MITTPQGNLKVSRAEIDSIVNTNSTKKCPASFGHDRLLKAVQENDYFIVQCIIKVHAFMNVHIYEIFAFCLTLDVIACQ